MLTTVREQLGQALVRRVGGPDGSANRARIHDTPGSGLGSRPSSRPADLCWPWGCSQAARRGAVLFPGDSP